MERSAHSAELASHGINYDPLNSKLVTLTDVQKQMICELCHTPSELLYGRNVGMSRYTKGLQKTKNWWRVDHGKHPTCERRYDTLGAGETQEEAIKQAMENIKQHGTRN